MTANTQARRSRITVAQTIAASASNVDAGTSPNASRTTGSCRPTSTKRSAFSRYCTISQTAVPCRRTWAVVSSGVCQPR